MSEIAGTLSERVTIERRDPARDAIGGATGGWTGEGSFWAAIRAERADGFDAPARWRVTLRGRDIGFEHRIGWAGRHLRVVAIADDAGRTGLVTVIAEEERGGGFVMIESVQQRIADRRARIAAALRTTLPGDVAIEQSAEGVVLSGRRLRYRALTDPAFRDLATTIRRIAE
jgi:head-tail adaptor